MNLLPNLKVIKTILDYHGSIHFPYKEKLEDYYSGVIISFDIYQQKYAILKGTETQYFDTAEKAIKSFEYYMHPKNNIGLALQMVMNEHPKINLINTTLVRQILKEDQYNF